MKLLSLLALGAALLTAGCSGGSDEGGGDTSKIVNQPSGKYAEGTAAGAGGAKASGPKTGGEAATASSE